jgi:hypothetical protein
MDNWGNTQEKHDIVQDYLVRNGFTAAPISIWFFDVEFIAPHLRALKSGDTEAVAWLRKAFTDTAEQQFRVQAAAARAMFGRDPVHIWLIHGTPLAADCLGAILDRFAAANVEFVSLEDAMADPMNSAAVPLITTRFLNQVQKWAEVEKAPIQDCPPLAILEAIERIAPMPGLSYPEIAARVFRAISDSVDGEFIPKSY